ncbi:MAG: hypothetical protein ACKOCM_11835 [Cyanobacteriota bacterium]
MAFTPSPAESEPSQTRPSSATSAPENRSTEPAGVDPDAAAGSGGASAETIDTAELDTSELIEQLQADRLWLLRQIDGGAYPDLRLDLAALERELGQLLDQAGERIAGA